jgi:glucosamine-6-phosphate deaminase
MKNIEPLRILKYQQLKVHIYASNEQMGQAAAQAAKIAILQAIEARGEVNIILATGNSQLTTLNALVQQGGIPWTKARFFHMDEYIGIDPTHPAGFSQFLHQHFLNLLPEKPIAFYPVPLLKDRVELDEAEIACREYERLLRQFPADLCLLGIGENGHIAFNDPLYALFKDPVWVKMVMLSPESRQQQVNEGHFPSVEATPSHAVTLTIPALLVARKILAIVPEARKAAAVRAALVDPINEKLPATILRKNGHATLFLDKESSAKL